MQVGANPLLKGITGSPQLGVSSLLNLGATGSPLRGGGGGSGVVRVGTSNPAAGHQLNTLPQSTSTLSLPNTPLVGNLTPQPRPLTTPEGGVSTPSVTPQQVSTFSPSPLARPGLSPSKVATSLSQSFSSPLLTAAAQRSETLLAGIQKQASSATLPQLNQMYQQLQQLQLLQQQQQQQQRNNPLSASPPMLQYMNLLGGTQPRLNNPLLFPYLSYNMSQLRSLSPAATTATTSSTASSNTNAVAATIAAISSSTANPLPRLNLLSPFTGSNYWSQGLGNLTGALSGAAAGTAGLGSGGAAVTTSTSTTSQVPSLGNSHPGAGTTLNTQQATTAAVLSAALQQRTATPTTSTS